MKKKTFVLLLALVLIAGAAVGGTLAWLTDTTDAVQNTFTTSNIEIELDESDNLDLKMIPGWTITKDPKVTVIAGSEKCYLFVKIEKSSNFDNFMTYTVAADWTPLNDTNNDGVADDGVYYRVVNASDADQEFAVLKDNQVSVLGTVTKADMEALKAANATLPTLTFTAYATQYMSSNEGNFTPADAWTNVQPTT